MTTFTASCSELKAIANHIRRNDHHNPLLGVIHRGVQGYRENQSVTISVTILQNQYLNELES